MITTKILVECLHCTKEVEVKAVACPDCTEKASELKQVASGLSSIPDYNRPHKFEQAAPDARNMPNLCAVCDRHITDTIHEEPAGIFPANCSWSERPESGAASPPVQCDRCGIVDASGLTPRTGSVLCDPHEWIEITCTRPPRGWFCTREKDHDGPCAAHPVIAGQIETLGDLTLRELQTQLPWTVHYHRDFRSSPMTHKDFAHALLHVTKATGKLAAVVNDAEHGGSEFLPEEVDRFVADLVVCALRMANTCPGRTIDLQRAVEDRIELKNEAELRREKQ